jgi:hypothetical protein
MKRTIAAATIAAAVCNIGVPAFAQTVTLYGSGSHKGGCGEWVRATNYSVFETSYSAWLLGYLSAVNDLVPGVDNVTESRSNSVVLDWMKLWCWSHPLDQTVMAANALVRGVDISATGAPRLRRGRPAPARTAGLENPQGTGSAASTAVNFSLSQERSWLRPGFFMTRC